MINALITADVLEALSRSGVDTPTRDARRLARWAWGQAPYDPVSGGRDMALVTALFQSMVLQRAEGKPVSKIIGQRAFWKHEFFVNEHVLDPRPDTETLIEQALSAPFSSVLDLGTGSGCILISLLHDCPKATGVGTDLSHQALAVAQRNISDIGVGARAQLACSDWFENVTGQYDLIVSNPPYIALEEMPGLSREVRGFDPRLALTDEGDGLAAYRKIAAGVGAFLAPAGWLRVEIGPTQAGSVSELFREAGLLGITVSKDLDGRDRVVSGQAPT